MGPGLAHCCLIYYILWLHLLITFHGYILMFDVFILNVEMLTSATPALPQRFLTYIYTFHKDFKTLIKP